MRNRWRDDLVNLDALILREDFAEFRLNPEPPSDPLPEALQLTDLVDGIGSTALRKPDYQRETSCWPYRRVAEYVRSFVEGYLIPAVILWRSPTTGNIFVIDGSHRLSALIAWVRDDYGDNATSLAFFRKPMQREHWKAAQRTRSLIEDLVGSYDMLQAAAKDPENSDPIHVTRARNANTLPIPVLWVGNSAK